MKFKMNYRVFEDIYGLLMYVNIDEKFSMDFLFFGKIFGVLVCV